MWNLLRRVRTAPGALAISIALIAVACSSDSVALPDTPAPEPVTSFYIEARIQVDADEPGSPFPPDGPAVSNFRWWSESPDLFRQEIETVLPLHLAGTSMIVTEDDQWVSFDSNLNRYRSSPAPTFPEGTVPAPISSVLIGPLRGQTIQTQPAEFLAL